MIEISDTDCAYAAGLFDGEGCVLIMPGPKVAPYRMRLKVEVSQVEPAALYWLALRFGGKVILRSTPSTARARLAYRWDLCGRNAVAFLRQIAPWLLIKAAHAKVAFEFVDTLQAKGGIRREISTDVVDRRTDLRNRMRVLNRRGA